MPPVCVNRLRSIRDELFGSAPEKGSDARIISCRRIDHHQWNAIHRYRRNVQTLREANQDVGKLREWDQEHQQ